jgi:methylated-DNA-[protein]-cysteine S-methyltransferase
LRPDDYSRIFFRSSLEDPDNTPIFRFTIPEGLSEDGGSVTLKRGRMGMSEIRCRTYSSPIGLIEMTGENDFLTGLNFIEKTAEFGKEDATSILSVCERQLREYFSGARFDFDLPLTLAGTSFQNDVWAALRAVPFGATMSYGELARRIGRPAAVRAVGAANGANPISIIIPCHRILGNDGRLTGYGGGLWRKEWLLAHERKFRTPDGPLFAGR